jgi:hypothetical protein
MGITKEFFKMFVATLKCSSGTNNTELVCTSEYIFPNKTILISDANHKSGGPYTTCTFNKLNTD